MQGHLKFTYPACPRVRQRRVMPFTAAEWISHGSLGWSRVAVPAGRPHTPPARPYYPRSIPARTAAVTSSANVDRATRRVNEPRTTPECNKQVHRWSGHARSRRLVQRRTAVSRGLRPPGQMRRVRLVVASDHLVCGRGAGPPTDQGPDRLTTETLFEPVPATD